MSNYLWDNLVLDRHAKIANGMPVESELEFAFALVMLGKFPDTGLAGDEELLDSFLDRRRVLADQRGSVGVGLAVIVTLVGLALWGWTHSSSAPNGATLLGLLILAVAAGIVWTFSHLYRRAEARGKAYTAEMESRLSQDTTGAHYLDGV